MLGISFLLSSLKVVPAVLLERELRFQPLVAVEIVETLIFNGLLIITVLANLGIWSFSIAALARGLSGTSLIYILAPVKLSLGIEKTAAKKLLTFGLPFQANSLLALVKDRLVPLVVAGMVGPLGIGFITWAQNMAFLPLEMMNIIIRISFPAFSRLQGNKDNLGRAVEKSLFVTALLVYPALFGLAAILPSLVTYVISSKWQPALLGFYFFAFSTFWAVISTTFTNTLNAIGHIKTTLKLMILWTVSTWVLTPLLVLKYGYLGVALASFVISFTSLLPVILVKRVLVVRVLNALAWPVVASSVMAGTVYLFAQNFVRDVFTLILAVTLGIIVYALVISFKGKV